MSTGSWMFLGEDPDRPSAPARELYGVFRRPASPSDLQVQRLARRDAYGGSEDAYGGTEDPAIRTELGTPLYDEARLLVGNATQGIYAVPTTAEAVCLGSFPDGGGSCGRPGPHGLRVAYDDPTPDGLPFLLYGIVGDEVVGVDVVAGGATLHAELGENGYLLELASGGRDQLEKLTLKLRSGATDGIPLQVRPQLK